MLCLLFFGLLFAGCDGCTGTVKVVDAGATGAGGRSASDAGTCPWPCPKCPQGYVPFNPPPCATSPTQAVHCCTPVDGGH